MTAEQLVNRMNTNQRSVVQIKSVWWCGVQASPETRLRSEANLKRRHRGNQQVECQVSVRTTTHGSDKV